MSKKRKQQVDAVITRGQSTNVRMAVGVVRLLSDIRRRGNPPASMCMGSRAKR